MKKAQGLSMEIVIVAIILLLVLAVMIYVFQAKGLGPFTKQVESCAAKGGKCMQQCSDDYPVTAFTGCTENGAPATNSDWVCCLKFKTD